MARAQKGKKNPNWQHGFTGTSLHKRWMDMHSRCRAKRRYNSKYYSKKGIAVCDEWSDFLVFREWSLKNGYRKDLQIDRIDSDKGYSPKNCRWINRGDNVRRALEKCYSAYGETKSMKQWSLDDRCEVAYTTLTIRLKKGMKIKDALKMKTREAK